MRLSVKHPEGPERLGKHCRSLNEPKTRAFCIDPTLGITTLEPFFFVNLSSSTTCWIQLHKNVSEYQKSSCELSLHGFLLKLYWNTDYMLWCLFSFYPEHSGCLWTALGLEIICYNWQHLLQPLWMLTKGHILLCTELNTRLITGVSCTLAIPKVRAVIRQRNNLALSKGDKITIHSC